jgi:hypothetical protein
LSLKPHLCQMEFLREQHVVSLADSCLGISDIYVADVFVPRPPYDEIQGFQAWAVTAREQTLAAMKRKNCVVTWIQLVVDHLGFMAILRFTHPVVMSQAKPAAVAILKCLPDEQRLAVKLGLRPLDEVDRDRIAAWQTLESLRPAVDTHEDISAEEPINISFVPKGTTFLAPPEEKPKTVAHFLEELEEEERSSRRDVEFLRPPRFMLTNGAEQPRGSASPNIEDPNDVWEWRVHREAVIVVLEVGERPERLTYLRCYRECRRQLLLQSRVNAEFSNACMLNVVRVAIQLAKDGCMPGPGEHGRKGEFIKRCATALQALDPSKESDPKKLSAQDQAFIRQALGGNLNTPYEGCLSDGCLDEETTWETVDLSIRGDPGDAMSTSRCTRCQYPKVFGRTVNSLRDIVGLQKVKKRWHCYLDMEWVDRK